MTDEGLSTGSIEKKKGNLLSFKLSNLPSMAITQADNTISKIPDQSNI